MKRTCPALSLAIALSLGTATALPIFAQSTPAPSASASIVPDADTDLLGTSFENQAAGISLRIPAGCQRIRSSGAGDDLGQFGNEKRKWLVKLNRQVRPDPTTLATTANNFGHPMPGLLDQTIAKLKRDLPGCQILRQDFTNTRDGDPKLDNNVAMIAVRYTTGGTHFLSQQAIIQSTDRLFYLLALTTPTNDSPGDSTSTDPREREAVETFRQMLDSVRLLDTTKIALDQHDRLIRTRALMVDWTAAKLHRILIDQQWVRILRNGKDIGYSYITEQTASGIPRPLTIQEVKAGKSDRDLVKEGDGVLIGVRARSLDPMVNAEPALRKRGPAQVDSATWMFVTPDRRLEDWSRVIVTDEPTTDKSGKRQKGQTEEFGSSNLQIIRALDKTRLPGTPLDPRQPAISVHEQYTLNVETVSQSGQGEPVHRDLAPWYLPQALGYLLPRLLPLRPRIEDGQEKSRSYLFATYVPETREVMQRYVDVGDEQMVNFNGRIIRAVPIEDRIGWGGTPTTHYMTPDGVYLGSENKESHLMMLPTDEATLKRIWKDADLTRPHGTVRPAGVHSWPPAQDGPAAPADTGAPAR